ncbi:MAG: PIG-L family deacetylase [Candidatus Heimdallarchaeota archaeon]|nr:PIG-L family deacetylase [Candidatus Heimdallarchaeota archaeon]
MDIVMSIFAHPDDETFSAGGTLALYGPNAYAVCVTFDKKREEEFKLACTHLGINPIQLSFNEISALTKQEINNKLQSVIRKYQPTHIITHVDYDYHQEHRLLREIVEEAVEWASHTTNPDVKAHQVQYLWAAETTVLIPVPDIFIDISEVNHKRLKAIDSYDSQYDKGGAGFYHRFHNTRTSLRGIQSEVDHAEAFVVVPIATVGAFKPLKVKTSL